MGYAECKDKSGFLVICGCDFGLSGRGCLCGLQPLRKSHRELLEAAKKAESELAIYRAAVTGLASREKTVAALEAAGRFQGAVDSLRMAISKAEEGF